MREEVKPAVKPVCSGQAVQAGLPSEEDMKESGVGWVGKLGRVRVFVEVLQFWCR